MPCLQSRSRGVTENIFKTYKFILVFVDREQYNLPRFKKALIAAKGPQIAPQGQGRVVHLGAYLGKMTKSTEIVDAPKADDGSQSRPNWDAKTGQIKVGLYLGV